jgi:hypothetical protein
MSLTTDPNDPALGRGVDAQPREQNEKYLVLSEEERRRGFVRPVRRSYTHVGPAPSKYPLRDLTDDEQARYAQFNYVKFEAYPESEAPVTGRYWTQAELDKIGKGCGTVTTMAQDIAETYARDPKFYGSTYCMACRRHLLVAEFVWEHTDIRLGS